MQHNASNTQDTEVLRPPTPLQLKAFNAIEPDRATRSKPVALVVEDQVFSRNLLLNLLGRLSTVYAAADAHEAVRMYLEHVPDMAFLDIELPGNSGHEIAALIRQFDPQAFIVMVTGNHYVADIDRARRNGVNGFVVKPYSKQKIFGSVDRFLEERKTQRSMQQ